ncbi:MULTISPECIES: GntR family transcriptional regulator [Capnocytophaga]|uniref:GntR family transcriptional regulator n=1 Tax=Capnocytophaga canimorsus TaxID=28188 RepID=A0A250G2U8_9FLAO|nr:MULTISPECIES: GntR family transcriptional regulator [Capnocytophaga]ATA91739.1 GntR family transcriptional regulator [Capnocytophaga canimorsus]GJQ06682.1 GntR family transcriptional regulator [Capnocytophaga cynodegmi]
MELRDSGQAIYLQIADYICQKILLGEWQPETKIPSVRELAVQMSVNPNTVARSYEFLKNNGIIIDRRGVGYFVETNGTEQARKYRQQEFLQNELPSFFNTLYTLGIELTELQHHYENFKTTLNQKQNENQ